MSKTIQKKQPILITAGGTGGHVYPGLAVARALLDQNIPVVWMGTKQGIEAKVISDAGIEIEWLTVSGLRGKGISSWLLAPFRLTNALLQARKIIKKRNPSAVLGMGGFVAGPGGLLGALMGIPLIIHEQNAVAGTTNRLLSRFAIRILEGFPNTFDNKHDKVLVVGNPVRQDIIDIPQPKERLANRTGPLRLLVVGGSLGALKLNKIVPEAIDILSNHIDIEIVHQAGERTLKVAKEQYGKYKIQAHIVSFIEDMAGAYEWADVVVCRAGALTIAEISAAGLASILVPYPYAIDDHQTANGKYLAEKGGAVLTEESELTATMLADVIGVIANDSERLMTMSVNARLAAKHNATEEVAALVASYAGYAYIKNNEFAIEKRSLMASLNDKDLIK